MPERFDYDFSHKTAVAGKMGRLQTQAVIPIVAGDSVSIDMGSVVRLSALRRQLTLDAKVDCFAFFVPHRHVYGSDWIDFIKAGTDEGITFTAGPNANEEMYLGTPLHGTAVAIPLWLTHGYNEIWNRYFKPPTSTASVAKNYITGDSVSDEGRYGFLCARLKRAWSTGIDATTVAADREVSTAGTVLDIVDLRQVRARYTSEQYRDYFGQFYDDSLGSIWGGGANPDADERPYLCMHKESWLSGYDVDGTDDASLGSFAGKSAGVVTMRMPRRFFPEHGILWLMTLLRFPNIFNREKHYLADLTNPSYLEIAGDPYMVGAEPPAMAKSDEWFYDAASNDIGTIPYGQWYREQPNYVHRLFENLQGYPFNEYLPSTADEARLHRTGDHDAAFASQQLGHWNAVSHVGMRVRRVVPPARRSIFAGGV